MGLTCPSPGGLEAGSSWRFVSSVGDFAATDGCYACCGVHDLQGF